MISAEAESLEQKIATLEGERDRLQREQVVDKEALMEAETNLKSLNAKLSMLQEQFPGQEIDYSKIEELQKKDGKLIDELESTDLELKDKAEAAKSNQATETFHD